MSEFEKQEALWDTENGMANREDAHTEVQVEAVTETAPDDFEIPDIPAVFPVPEPSNAPAEVSEQQAQSQAAPQTHVWNSKTAKQQVKDAKRKYRLEKKRLRQEKRMRGPGWWRVVTTSLTCALVGGVIGAVITVSALAVTNQVFHIDLLDLKPEQIEVIREQYVAQIQEYKSPGTAVYKKNAGSVVSIQMTGEKSDSVWDQQSVENNMVSGVVYREDGYILTNIGAIRNVLETNGSLKETASITVTLPQKENASYPASVVGYDWETDVALLRIDATQLYAVEMGDSAQMQHGETVFTMMYTDDSEALYIQESMVSHLQTDIFYVDAAEERGWNHSPIFSAEGQFIGMNSTTTDGDASFAIPANRIVQACNKIIEEDKKT